ncbi:hypothetical protein PY650_34300 [Rhizobium calliandrae]|uniref:Rap1a immunity protein domain-containing protein n=1 Tax=Rhizobium calliandrae TaxID=1312182 RepID=A0ABT7KPL2_9HYPH|nr:hypothetical protein [Rhizobium calliandrae]MDL2410563.1 hypothetical protein [Rhizobium calliandrae]
MKTVLCSAAIFAAVVVSATAQSQPGLPTEDAILEMASRIVIDQYKTSSCEDLRTKKGAPPSGIIAQGVSFMRDHPSTRIKFINLIAAPVANRMFECGMIP